MQADDVKGYVNALTGLSLKQAELVLSTKGLSTAQQQAVLSQLSLANATGKLTTAQLIEIMTTKSRSKADAEALLLNTGLITSETAEATATNVVTAAKLQELVQTKALTQAEANLIAAKSGVISANQKESASFLSGIGAKFKGLGNGIKSAGSGVLALAKAHPIIAAITAAASKNNFIHSSILYVVFYHYCIAISCVYSEFA